MSAEVATLPPFHPQGHCTACDWNGASVEHQEPFHVHAGYQRSNECEPGCLPERLARRCGRCGFMWDEQIVEAAT